MWAGDVVETLLMGIENKIAEISENPLMCELRMPQSL